MANDLVREKKCKTLEEAQQKAGAEVANTGGFAVPVVTFRQGKRLQLTGALPMSWVRSRLEARSAKPRASIHDARSAWNRPEDQGHSDAIKRYLLENFEKGYIIPPLTLNVQQTVDLYSVDYPSGFGPGYMVIPATAKLAITDGQHRRTGIIQALDAMDDEMQQRFGQNAVAVMITCESDIKQIHQDFADCSKTRALPPSLLSVFDTRNPANRLVADLEERCPLFNGRIDSTSKSLSKRSTALFLANQLRQFIKELMFGSYSVADVEFEKRAVERLKTEVLYSDALDKYSQYVTYLTDHIPTWQQIAGLDAGLQAAQIPLKRAEGWVCLSATGLNLIGRVGHELFTQGIQDWRGYADKLAAIDWSRTAPIWQGNIVLEGKKLLTQQGPLKAAYLAVCSEIGLQPRLPRRAASEGLMGSSGFDSVPKAE